MCFGAWGSASRNGPQWLWFCASRGRSIQGWRYRKEKYVLLRTLRMIDVEDDQVFQTREPPQTPGRISSSHHFQARKALDNSIRVEDDERMTWGMHPVVPYRLSIRHDEDCDRGYRCAVGSAAGLRDDHHSDCRLPVSASFVLLPWTSELAFQHHESQPRSIWMKPPLVHTTIFDLIEGNCLTSHAAV